MTIPVVFFAAGMVFLAAFLSKRVKGATASAVILKSYASLGFIAAAMSAILIYKLSGAELLYGVMIGCGLLFGLLGDIWLDLKYAHSKYSKEYTYAGIISFILGHTMYVSGIIKYFCTRVVEIEGMGTIIIPSVICVVVGILMIFSEKPMKVKYGEYKAIIIIYSVFIAALPAFSISFARVLGFKNIVLDLMATGSVFFCISDAILTGTYFGEGKDRPVDIITNHITYYLAQYAIALSLCFLVTK